MRIDWKFMKKRKAIPLVLSLALIAGVCIAAGCKKKAPEHEHTFATEWTTDESGHWYGATCEHTDEKSGYAEHEYDNACDTTCNVCDAEREIEHDYKDTLTVGKTYHWYECEVCGEKKDEAEHEFTEEIASDDTLKAAATDTTKAQYWKSCECGAISTTVYFETDKTVTTLTNIKDLSKTYDGAEIADPTYETNSDGAVTFEWYQGDTKLDAKPVNAGAYKVKVIVAETVTYTGVSETVDFEIKPHVFKNISTGFAYNGTNTFTYKVMNKEGLTFNVTFESKNVDAALKSVEVLQDGIPTENYIADISKLSMKIQTRTITLEWTAPSNLVYDGTEKIPTATPTNVLAGDDCTIKAYGKFGDNVNVGTFRFNVSSLTGADAGNYYVTSNPGGSSYSPNYTITPKALSIPKTIYKDYDGEKSVSYSFTSADGLIGSDSCTLTFNATDASNTDAIAAGFYEDAKMSDITLSNANYKLETTTCDLRILDPNALILQATDVFTIQGEFVITVAVKQGTVSVGDSIVLPGTPDKVYEVLKIESFRQSHESATVGEGEVGLYVDGMADTSEVSAHSFLYAYDNLPKMATEFLAEVYLRTQDEGGRRIPVTDGYRPQFHGIGLPQTSIVTLVSHYGKEDADVWAPGETILAKITLTTPVPASLLNSLEFTMSESDKTVITGVVVDEFVESKYSGGNGYMAAMLNTEALTPVVYKITHVGTSNALTRMRFYEVKSATQEDLLTDFTVELYDESFTQIAATYDNETGRFIKSDSSEWSLGVGETCYVVLKTTNATNNVRLMLFNN